MNVLLVDDHALLREGVALLISQGAEAAQVWQAASIAEACTRLGDTPPIDLVLLDRGLPDASGLDGLTRLRSAYPAPRYVLISAECSADLVLAAIQAGACGYVPKTTQAAVMMQAIALVLAGGIYLPAAVMAASMPGSIGNAERVAGSIEGLSPRQNDVLNLLLEGKSNKEIGRLLELSESTVKTHMEAIFRRLNVRSRTEAVVLMARASQAPAAALLPSGA